LTAADRRRNAYHEAGHALVGMLTPGADPVRKISITADDEPWRHGVGAGERSLQLRQAEPARPDRGRDRRPRRGGARLRRRDHGRRKRHPSADATRAQHGRPVRDERRDRLRLRPDRPPVEGRFERWGKWEEYDNWLTGTAPRALRIGRSTAVQSIDIGETITVPVDVHNRSAVAQSGAVELELPANFTADAASKPYGTLAPGEQATVEFELTNTDATLPANQVATIPIETSYSAPAGAGREDLAISLVPTTAIPEASAAPELDGSEGAGEYGGPALDVGKRWEETNCDP
jgi:hypothetical protein